MHKDYLKIYCRILHKGKKVLSSFLQTEYGTTIWCCTSCLTPSVVYVIKLVYKNDPILHLMHSLSPSIKGKAASVRPTKHVNEGAIQFVPTSSNSRRPFTHMLQQLKKDQNPQEANSTFERIQYHEW